MSSDCKDNLNTGDIILLRYNKWDRVAKVFGKGIFQGDLSYSSELLLDLGKDKEHRITVFSVGSLIHKHCYKIGKLGTLLYE